MNYDTAHWINLTVEYLTKAIYAELGLIDSLMVNPESLIEYYLVQAELYALTVNDLS